MEQKIARVFSVILHPVFIPLLAAVVIFRMPLYPFTFYSPNAMYVVLGQVMVFNVITPLFLIYLYKKAGFISSYTLETKRDRILPLFTFALMLYLTSMISENWNLPPLWNVILLFFALLTLLSLLLTFFFRVSLHLTGWGGLIGLVIVLIAKYQVPYLYVLSILLLISGVSAWSRAVLKQHKALEMIVGFALGVCVMVAGMFLLQVFN